MAATKCQRVTTYCIPPATQHAQYNIRIILHSTNYIRVYVCSERSWSIFTHVFLCFTYPLLPNTGTHSHTHAYFVRQIIVRCGMQIDVDRVCESSVRLSATPHRLTFDFNGFVNEKPKSVQVDQSNVTDDNECEFCCFCELCGFANFIFEVEFQQIQIWTRQNS